MKMTSRILKGALALGLITALAAPVTALAVPGRGFSGTKMPGTPKASAEASRHASRDQRQAQLKQRIEMVLKIREERFDAIAGRLSDRITKVSGFAGRIEQAGGDVSAVRAKLAEAGSLLEQAKSEEARAIELFRAVPDATDKKAAFAAARAQSKTAVKTLHSARQVLRNAILSLRAIANGLKGAGQ
jgi:hypothetical protein